jgi:hypothetical protein
MKEYFVSLVFQSTETFTNKITTSQKLVAGQLSATSAHEALGKFYSEQSNKLMGYNLSLSKVVEYTEPLNPTTND